MTDKVDVCPYCLGTQPHQGPTGCPPLVLGEGYDWSGVPIEHQPKTAEQKRAHEEGMRSAAALIRAMIDYRNHLLDDLVTEYHGSPNYVADDDEWLTEQIEACNAFLAEHLAVDTDGNEL